MPGGPQFAVVGQLNQIPDSARNFAIRSDSGCMTVSAEIGNGDSIPFGMFVRTNDDYHGDGRAMAILWLIGRIGLAARPD
jgi:hypothetical protein